VQAKLRVSEPNDAFEQEAERVASEVMGESPENAPGSLRGQADEGMAQPLTDLGQDLAASRGRLLDPATRTFMESRFGHDFSRVRLHADEAAAAAARTCMRICRRADIFFGAGEHAPERSMDGDCSPTS
jgi:hypothetical protein